MDKCYIGLDLSLSGAGIVAVVDPDDDSPLSIKSGRILAQEVVGYSLTREATMKELIERQLFIAKAVIKTVKQCRLMGYDPEVAIENYAFSTVKNKKGKAFQSSSQTGLAELRGVVVSQLLMATGIIPVLYSVKTTRMVVLKNGNFPKKDVKPKLESWGYKFKDDNDADAFVIAECHRLKMEGWTDDRKKRKRKK